MSRPTKKLKNALQEYLDLLHKEEYFNAHEVLEEAWHPLRKAKHPLSNLVKGIINASIAFEHLKRNRPQAQTRALRVMVSYERHKHLLVEGILYQELFEKIYHKIELIKRNNVAFRNPVL